MILSKYWFYVYVHTKFGDNWTKITTFIRFIKFLRKVFLLLWDQHGPSLNLNSIFTRPMLSRSRTFYDNIKLILFSVKYSVMWIPQKQSRNTFFQNFMRLIKVVISVRFSPNLVYIKVQKYVVFQSKYELYGSHRSGNTFIQNLYHL